MFSCELVSLTTSPTRLYTRSSVSSSAAVLRWCGPELVVEAPGRKGRRKAARATVSPATRTHPLLRTHTHTSSTQHPLGQVLVHLLDGLGQLAHHARCQSNNRARVSEEEARKRSIRRCGSLGAPGLPPKMVKGGTTVSGGRTAPSSMRQQSLSTQRRPCVCVWGGRLAVGGRAIRRHTSSLYT